MSKEAKKKSAPPSQADLLVNIVETGGVELFHTPDREPFATVPVGEHVETHPVNAKAFRLWLGRKYWDQFKKSPCAQAVQDALGCVAGKAIFDGEERKVHVRHATFNGVTYLDLCAPDWAVVKVTRSGWSVIPATDAPVRFIRRRGMQPIPTPAPGGSLDELRPLLNAGTEADWIMMLSWLVGALHPSGPFPILALNGEQGSAKSTTCRMLRRLIDPNQSDLRSAPRDERDLMIAACNSHVVAFDNLSFIQPSLSDALCRLATGAGFSTRELYSDDEEKLFAASRPIVLNGIEELATRADLLDRCIALSLPTIPDSNRRDERGLWAEYDRLRPRILGALLDAVAEALRNLPTVVLDEPPRMADFAVWVVAAETALPWEPGKFLSTYQQNRAAVDETALEASAVGALIVDLVANAPNRDWKGTAAQLHQTLTHRAGERSKSKDWPATGRAMANALRRIAPTLRRLEVAVTFSRDGRARRITLEQIPGASSPSSPSSQGASGEPENGFVGDASDDAVTQGDDEHRHHRHHENGDFEPETRSGDASDASDDVLPVHSIAVGGTAEDEQNVDELFGGGES